MEDDTDSCDFREHQHDNNPVIGMILFLRTTACNASRILTIVEASVRPFRPSVCPSHS